MNNRNLMPVQRLHAKRVQRAVGRWLLIDSAYLVVLVLTGGFYAWSRLSGSNEASAAPVSSSVEKYNASLVSLRQESVGLKTNLQSCAQVSNRADWSILLAAISKTLGDNAVLNAIDCEEEKGAANSAVNPAPLDSSSLRFRLSGMGRNQQSVMELILRLQELKFFSRVQLVETAPQALRGVPSVAFQLVCDLQANQEGHK